MFSIRFSMFSVFQNLQKFMFSKVWPKKPTKKWNMGSMDVILSKVRSLADKYMQQGTVRLEIFAKKLKKIYFYFAAKWNCGLLVRTSCKFESWRRKWQFKMGRKSHKCQTISQSSSHFKASRTRDQILARLFSDYERFILIE